VDESTELIRHSGRLRSSEPRDAQPDVIALYLDVIFNTGEACDLMAAANKAFGVTQAELSWVDLLGLFLDVLEQSLQ
jgi:hypothetical protein